VLADQTASGEGSSTERYNVEARGKLNADARPDVLSALLYSNYGPFGDIIAPGTYDLSGTATDFATCGVCILLDTDTNGPTEVTDVYMPTSGTLTITQAGARFVATLTDVQLRHVLIPILHDTDFLFSSTMPTPPRGLHRAGLQGLRERQAVLVSLTFCGKALDATGHLILCNCIQAAVAVVTVHEAVWICALIGAFLRAFVCTHAVRNDGL